MYGVCPSCNYRSLLLGRVCEQCEEELDKLYPNRVQQPTVPIWTLANIPDSGEPF